jgi:FKBP-type peptidyl-prolyl cis-trans isomerase
MQLFTKTEAVGIFLSVAVMAVALAVIRFQTDAFTLAQQERGAADQPGAVVVAQTDSDALTQEIKDSVTLDGTLSRLVIDDVRIGTGQSVQLGNTVLVHYIGTLRDGTQFDNSYLRNEPFELTLGEGKVIKGWEEGLIGMQTGGRRILVIPAEMAYGNRQVGPIPPNSALIFSVELVEIKS